MKSSANDAVPPVVYPYRSKVFIGYTNYKQRTTTHLPLVDTRRVYLSPPPGGNQEGSFYMGCMCCFLSYPSTRQVTLGGLDGGLVIGCWEGGYNYFPSGYVLAYLDTIAPFVHEQIFPIRLRVA